MKSKVLIIQNLKKEVAFIAGFHVTWKISKHRGKSELEKMSRQCHEKYKIFIKVRENLQIFDKHLGKIQEEKIKNPVLKFYLYLRRLLLNVSVFFFLKNLENYSCTM